MWEGRAKEPTSPISVVVLSMLMTPGVEEIRSPFPPPLRFAESLVQADDVPEALLLRPLMLGSRSVRGIVPPREVIMLSFAQRLYYSQR